MFYEKMTKDTCNHCNASLPSDRMCNNPFSKLKLLHINGNIREQEEAFKALWRVLQWRNAFAALPYYWYVWGE